MFNPAVRFALLSTLALMLPLGCGAAKPDIIRVSLAAARAVCSLIPPAETSSSGSDLFSAPAPERAHVEVHRDGAVEFVADPNDASAQ